MKKIYFLLLFGLSLSSILAQDIIKTQNGKEYKAKVIDINKDEATFKNNDDPEFSTYTLDYDSIKTIQLAGEKKPIYFNHNLARAYLLGHLGASIPLGSFAVKEQLDSEAEPGYARVGTSATFETGFYIYKNLGLNISGTRIQNRLDDKEYRKIYNPNDTGTYQVTIGNNSEKGTSDHWKQVTFTVGLMYSILLGDRLTIDIIGKAGPNSTIKPDITIYNGADNSYYSYKSKEKTVFSYGGALNIRYRISNRLGIFLSGSLLTSQSKFNISTSEQVFNPSKNTYDVYNSGADVIHQLTTLNTNFGFVFLFKRKGNKYE